MHLFIYWPSHLCIIYIFASHATEVQQSTGGQIARLLIGYCHETACCGILICIDCLICTRPRLKLVEHSLRTARFVLYLDVLLPIHYHVFQTFNKRVG